MQVFDHISIICWSIVYLIVVISGTKYRSLRQVIMPMLPGSLNLAWELNALSMSRGFYGHVLWAGLNLMIFTLNIHNLRRKKQKLDYFLFTLMQCFVFRGIFLQDNGMLVSSFLINAIMSLVFIVQGKKLSPKGRMPIVILKMIGTGAATIYYSKYSVLVCLLGIACFLLDLFYLCCCLEDGSRKKRSGRRR